MLQKCENFFLDHGGPIYQPEVDWGKPEGDEFPNCETMAAIDDVDHSRNLSWTFHSVSDLMEDLNT